MAAPAAPAKSYRELFAVKISTGDSDTAFVVAAELIPSINIIHDFFESDNEVTITSDTVIPLNNLTDRDASKILAYLAAAHRLKDAPDELKAFQDAFVKMPQHELFELILACNYIDCKPLTDLCCDTVAGMIKGKSPEEIRKTFNLKNDFTPEEEEEVRRENQWALE